MAERSGTRALRQPIWRTPRMENAAGEATDPVSSLKDYRVWRCASRREKRSAVPPPLTQEREAAKRRQQQGQSCRKRDDGNRRLLLLCKRHLVERNPV